MNKKCLVVLLVLVLTVSGLFAKDSGFKVGGQLGWGFDVLRMKEVFSERQHGLEVGDSSTTKMKNNGFAFNVTGEYDFDKNWGVVANLGMMFVGKTTAVVQYSNDNSDDLSCDKAGLYFDFAIDAKYTLPINEKLSVSGLAGLELVAGYLLKGYERNFATLGYGPSYTDSDFYNVAIGLNLGVEGSYKVTDKISVVGGVTGAWFFVNSAKIIKDFKETGEYKVSGVASFYIRPYVGATYSF